MSPPRRTSKPPAIPDRDSIGGFIRSRRKANRLTQRALAELAGVGPRFLSELEADKSTVRIDAVNRVLAIFGKQLGIVELPRDANSARERELS